MALLAKHLRGPKMILPADNHTILRPETFTGGFTQSEIGTWDDCAEKWYLGYNHRLERKGGFEWHFVYGDAVHEALAHFYRTGEMQVASLQFPEGVILTSKQEYERDMWQAILEVQLERYAIHYADDLEVFSPWAVEELIEFEFEGVLLRGKIDLGYDLDGLETDILSDHKTYGLDDYEGWNFRFQFMFYIWLVQKALKRKIKKFVVNGIRKPQLRQGKNESLASFAVRIKQAHIQEPLKYFTRHNLPMIKNSMEHFEERVLRPKLERIKALTQGKTPAIIIESLVRNQNTHTCVRYGQTCEFLPICKHGYQRDGHFYTQRQDKHVELATLQNS